MTRDSRSRYLQLSRFDRLDVGRVLAHEPQLESAWRLPQRLYGIDLAADDEEATQAVGAFIAAYEDQPRTQIRERSSRSSVS